MKQYLSSLGHTLESILLQIKYDKRTRQIVVRTILGIFLVCYAVWNYGGKRWLYQNLYGKKDDTPLQIEDFDHFYDLPKQPIQKVHINGFDIEVEIIKRFETTSRVTYIDRYTKLGTWYRSHEGATLYDAVVPQDISLASGETGRNYHCFEFSHIYRAGGSFSKYKCEGWWSVKFPSFGNDISNNHSIAANKTIQKGIDILKAGDIAHIEGFLIFWNGTGKLSYQRFESAITLNQVSDFIDNGQHPQLCRQLFITKLTFDGYTFE